MIFLAFVGFFFCRLDSFVRKFPKIIGIPSNRLDFRKKSLSYFYLFLLPSFPDTTTSFVVLSFSPSASLRGDILPSSRVSYPVRDAFLP